MTKLYFIVCLIVGLLVGFGLMSLFRGLGATFISIGDVIATYFFSVLFSVIGGVALILRKTSK